MNHRAILTIATLALGGAFGLAGCIDDTSNAAVADRSSESIALADAEAVDEIEVVVADAETIRKAIDAAKGAVVVVNFWATWCPPCVAEIPALVEFYEAHREDELRFISLSGDHQSTLEVSIKPFVAERGLPFDVYVMDWDEPADMEAIAATLDLGWDGVFPTTYILDRESNIVFSKAAEVSREELDAVVAPLFEK